MSMTKLYILIWFLKRTIKEPNKIKFILAIILLIIHSLPRNFHPVLSIDFASTLRRDCSFQMAMKICKLTSVLSLTKFLKCACSI